MKRNSKLSAVLHTLLHMAHNQQAMTSAQLARVMDTNPVVVRRTMAGLRKAGLVTSEKGHGGGWRLAEGWGTITLKDIHIALGGHRLIAPTLGLEHPQCLVEQAVNAALGDAFDEAEAMLVRRLSGISLEQLARDFNQRAATHGTPIQGH